MEFSIHEDTRNRKPGTVTMHTGACDDGQDEPNSSSLEILPRLESRVR